jgi:hypothetical protein
MYKTIAGRLLPLRQSNITSSIEDMEDGHICKITQIWYDAHNNFRNFITILNIRWYLRILTVELPPQI